MAAEAAAAVGAESWQQVLDRRRCCVGAPVQALCWRAGEAAAAEDEGEGDQPGQVAGQRRAQGCAQHQGGPGDRQRASRVGGRV